MHRSRVRPVRAGLAAAALAALLVASCADDPLAEAPEVAAAIAQSKQEHPDAWKRRVILIGMDSCDPDLLEDLIRRGKAPNFARMRREGAHGALQSLTPLLSPVVWTTISTGMLPERHGILDFVTETPQGMRPVSSRMRQADTVWELVGQAGEQVGVVGWLISWPAEPLNGFMVTDRIGKLAFEASRFGDSDEHDPDTVFPPELVGRVGRDRVTIDDLPLERLRAFADVTEEEYADSYATDFADQNNLLGGLRLVMADAETFRKVGTDLYRERRPRLFATYFNAMDALSHMFMPLAPPKMPHVPEELFVRFRDVIEANYVWHDRVLGEYMDLADENTTVIVVSDHGFKHGALRTEDSSAFAARTGAAWHRRYGIVYMWGGGVKPGTTLTGASVYDIAPTVLAAMGYPVPEEMPGDVLEKAFVGGLPHETVKTWFGERRRKQLARETAADPERASDQQSPEDAEERARLEALGYVSGDRNDPASTTLNLGARYLATRRYKAAIELYEGLLKDPKQAANPRAVISLARAQLIYGEYLRKAQRAEESDAQLAAAEDQLLLAEQKGADPTGVLQLRSRLARVRGQLENAELLAKAAVERAPLEPSVHIELAEILREQMEKAQEERRPGDAELYRERAKEALRRALEREPRQFHVLTELARIELAALPGPNTEPAAARTLLLDAAKRALELLDRALELIPRSPKALNNRGIALLRLGIGAKEAGDAPAASESLEEALHSLEIALEVQPKYPIGWANKAYVLWWLDRLPDARTAALEARELDPAYRFNGGFVQVLDRAGTPLPPPGE